jgi:hypothetical protein
VSDAAIGELVALPGVDLGGLFGLVSRLGRRETVGEFASGGLVRCARLLGIANGRFKALCLGIGRAHRRVQRTELLGHSRESRVRLVQSRERILHGNGRRFLLSQSRNEAKAGPLNSMRGSGNLRLRLF